MGSILLLFGSLAFCCIIGEVICRLEPVVSRTGGCTPGKRKWAEKNYDRLEKKNKLNLRSFHVDKSKKPEDFRIVTIGDSLTWGKYVARTKDTWPYIMENLFRQDGWHVDVINIAKRGYTTVNEAEALDRYGWSFDPDLIVLQFFINDPLPSGPGFKRMGSSLIFKPWPLSPIGHVKLENNSYLYSFLYQHFKQFQLRYFYPPDIYAPLYEDDFEGWQACKAAFNQMSDHARQRDVPMLAVVWPRFTIDSFEDGSYPDSHIHNKVLSAIKEAELPVLDLLPVFAKYGYKPRHWWVLPSDAHPSIEAHRVAGKAIAEKLKELKFIP